MSHDNQWEHGWTDERTARAIKLQADGLSASQIAVELGFVTRNAVIGKLKREGYTGKYTRHRGGGHPPIIRPPKIPRVKRTGQELNFARRQESKAQRQANRTQRQANAELRRSQFACTEIVDLTPEQSATKCTLLELNGHTCRWPLGNPEQADFGFCGAEPYRNGRDSPYCFRHTRIAHQARARA